MKSIKSIYYSLCGFILFTVPFFSYGAGLAKTKSAISDFETWIHSVVGIVFLITGVIVSTLIWRGKTAWDDCSKWVYGVIFAGAVAEIVTFFYT